MLKSSNGFSLLGTVMSQISWKGTTSEFASLPLNPLQTLNQTQIVCCFSFSPSLSLSGRWGCVP